MGNNFSYDTNKNEIVVDCDEVLVRISPKWVAKMHNKDNYDYFNEYLRLSKDFDIHKHALTVLSRPDFYLDRWLVRKDVFENHTTEEVEEMQSKMLDIYNNDTTYYDDLQPTNLGRSISFALKQPILKKVHVVSRVTSANIETKERFIKNLFKGSMNKVDIYYIEKNEKKSDVIANLGNSINDIYEDEISNIEDIVNNCPNITNCRIYIPSYGYNTVIPDKIKNLATGKNIVFKYYRDF